MRLCVPEAVDGGAASLLQPVAFGLRGVFQSQSPPTPPASQSHFTRACESQCFLAATAPPAPAARAEAPPNRPPSQKATIMTDPGMADRTYVGPMTPELVEQILDKVGGGQGILRIGPFDKTVKSTNCRQLFGRNVAVRDTWSCRAGLCKGALTMAHEEGGVLTGGGSEGGVASPFDADPGRGSARRLLGGSRTAPL